MVQRQPIHQRSFWLNLYLAAGIEYRPMQCDLSGDDGYEDGHDKRVEREAERPPMYVFNTINHVICNNIIDTAFRC